ncbi:enoyl-CoA hydratase/isomerase family protein [Mycolicibacterium sp. XJ1819]
MTTRVRTRAQDRIGWLQLDGPDRLNAIGSQTYGELAAAIRDVEGDSARAVIIHGSGRAFCAGADIAEMRGFTGRDEFAEFIRGFTDALEVLASSTLPVIAAIHGSALGGGLELALACDLRVSTPTAKLGLPEAKLGLLPGAGGTQRLPRLVPPGVANEMLMLGTPVDGRRAYELGLVNRLAEDEDLLEVAAGLARELADGAAQVPSAAKRLLQTTSTMPIEEGIERERATVADLFASPDGREGFAAFTERRAPRFGGG